MEEKPDKPSMLLQNAGTFQATLVHLRIAGTVLNWWASLRTGVQYVSSEEGWMEILS